MGDFYHDMPALVNDPRDDGRPGAFASFDSLRTLAPPQSSAYGSPPQPFLSATGTPQWPPYDPTIAGTPSSWGTSSMASTPMFAAAPPAMAVISPMVPLTVSSEGWPRPLATPAPAAAPALLQVPPANNSPPWRDMDDGYERTQPPPRDNTPLSRSLSLSSSPSSLGHRPSLSRKTSVVRGNAAEALKRPPREWRTDFQIAGSSLLSGLLGTRGRSRSFGGLGGGDPKVVLHPYIRYNASKPAMQLDLRDSPNSLSFRALKGQRLTSWDLMRFVCEPPLPFMRLFHVHLPWYIDVEAQNPAGVTLFELFMALHSCMVRQIENADYYNVEMDAEARARVAEAWSARCHNEEERAQGIRRVDYLMGRVIMEGIQKGKDGLWEIKTRKPAPADGRH